MAKAKPQDNYFDDLSDTEEDIDTLYNTYIRPIDSMRSNAKPFLSVGSSSAAILFEISYPKEASADEPLESRVHAFYRMLGMPVVSKKSGYYSPGYNPLGSSSAETRLKIDKAVYDEKTAHEFIYSRETTLEEYRRSFISQDSLEVITRSILYRYTFPFANFDPSIDHLEKDPQLATIENRTSFGRKFSQDNSNYSDKILSFSESFSKIFHALKPFVVDPAIASVVTPIDNIVCAPFLNTEKQTKILNNKSLFRPGLELIIRQRLEDSVISKEDLATLENILNGDTSNKATTLIDYGLLLTTVKTLAENSELPNNIKDELGKVKVIEYQTTVKLIKSIKFLVTKLLESQQILDDVRSNINWLPLPNSNPNGPLSGGKLYTTYYKNGNYLIDSKIKQLEIKKLNAESESKEFSKLGNFASPFVQNSFSEKVNKYNKVIEDLVSSRDEFTEKGFTALKNIEIIKGEISGIGLVDVLAFYVGLWSIDIKHLLYLIDDESAKRLSDYNPKYKGSPQVVSRLSQAATSQNVLEALKALEEKVYNVLKYADFYLEERSNPTQYTNSLI
jgi:hypothetical protein